VLLPAPGMPIRTMFRMGLLNSLSLLRLNPPVGGLPEPEKEGGDAGRGSAGEATKCGTVAAGRTKGRFLRVPGCFPVMLPISKKLDIV